MTSISKYVFLLGQKYIGRTALLFLLLLLPVAGWAQATEGGTVQAIQGDPPFGGTIFLDPDIIMASDPTTFQSLSYLGQDARQVFDRRVNAFITIEAYLFEATFDDGLSAEMQVNPEFGSPEAALVEAERYAPIIGRLPTALRTEVQTVSIHKGTFPFGGGNNNLLIHIGQADLYAQDGLLEETLVHEASHTSLDAFHASTTAWMAAQTADGEFISTYARDYPNREDIAESFLPYLAVRYRSNRISQDLYETILETIPNRISYFEDQSFDLYPIESTGVPVERLGDEFLKEFDSLRIYPNPFHRETTITFELSRPSRVKLGIVDLLGREVVVLAAGDYPAGRFEAAWKATGFPGGLYLCHLQTEAHSRTRSILLMK